MKKLALIFVTFLAIGASAQVSVKEQKVNVDGSKEGFYVSIPYGDQKQIEKALKDELKDWKGKYKSEKDYVFVDDCKLKAMGKNTFDVFAKVEANPDGGGNVSIAIDLGGAFLNSSDHGAQAKVINAKLHEFGIKAAKSVVDDEIKAEEKILKEREKELEDLEKEQEKMEKEIEDYKKKIKENEKAIEESKSSQDAKKDEIKTQAEKVKKTEEKKAAVK